MKTTTLIKDTKADKLFLGVLYTFLAIALLIVLYPLIYIVSASISNPHLVNSGEMWLFPKGVTLEGYRTLLEIVIFGEGI